MIDRAGDKSQADSARQIVVALNGRLDIQGADTAAAHYPARHDICVTGKRRAVFCGTNPARRGN